MDCIFYEIEAGDLLNLDILRGFRQSVQNNFSGFLGIFTHPSLSNITGKVKIIFEQGIFVFF